MSHNIKFLNDENFASTIAQGVTLVDFYADWCGPCRMIAPLVEELSQELEGQATIAKVDIENAQKVTSQFDVTSIPTLIVFKDGVEASRVIGLHDKEALKKMITAAL